MPATPIQITKTAEEPGSKSLKVEVSVERVRAVELDAARHYAKRAKLPGFRKGKAPLGVVRKQYREAIRETVIRDLVRESWEAALDQENLRPIADPRVRDLKFEADAPVTFELVVEVKPELNLQRLGGFTLTRKLRAVTAEMVDYQIEELRRQKAPWVPVEGEKPQPADLVSVTIQPVGAAEETAEAGQPGEAKQYQIQLGTGQAIPDLEEKIMMLSPGETLEAPVRFPDDFPDESKRGQTREVRLTLHELKRQDLPEVSDDFARELGDFDSVADLRNAVREDLESDARREADGEVRGKLMEQVIAANNVQAPKSMVQRALSAFAQLYEVPDDRLEEFAREFGPIAERQVQRDLVIDHIAERENLRATEEDVDRRIAEMAAKRQTEPGQVYASLQKAGRLRELERNLTEERVFEYLLGQSTIKDD
ncbi:MAG: trigger factor [Gemmatimonadales bacterium]